MSRRDIFRTQVFNLFGAPYVVERSDAPDVERKLVDCDSCTPLPEDRAAEDSYVADKAA